MAWYFRVLMNYVGFGGRARRREFWGFAPVHAVIVVLLVMVDSFLSGGANDGYGVLSGLYCLATLLPTLAVSARRLHDTGRSGLWILIALVPVLGWIVLLFFYLMDSEPGTNRYGPNPKLEYA